MKEWHQNSAVESADEERVRIWTDLRGREWERSPLDDGSSKIDPTQIVHVHFKWSDGDGTWDSSMVDSLVELF